MTFAFHSLRMKYESSEGSMMIDLATIHSLELVRNLPNPKSRDSLYGLLNQTLTPMGGRKLKSTILEPSTDKDVLEKRHSALAELTTKEDVFFAVRQALKSFVDTDRVLTAISLIPTKPTIQYAQQSINNVIMLKHFVKSVQPIYEALASVQSDLLKAIAEQCAPSQTEETQQLIDQTINEDVTYQSQPLDLRNQRTYAVRSGVNGLLDVARQTYKESNADAYQLVVDLGTEHGLALDLKYEAARQYYIRIPTSELVDRDLPLVFINVFRKKNMIECQTLDLLKWNQKIIDSHHEVIQMSDQSIQSLVAAIREDMSPLFKIGEAIALLDMMASFAQLVTTQNYTRPEMTSTLAIKSGRHPIHEKIHADRYVPNDAYATQQSRFQIITGCNMSGKSCYIRSIALMTVMAHLGSFVPATYASFPICHQLFARVSMDDSIEANVSTFASEMREIAFILRNIDKRSMVIVDELGRGTSTRDGLCIAIAVAEALVDSGALVWFVTHFSDLPRILAERSGVVSMHLQVEMITPSSDSDGSEERSTMKMLYRVAGGAVQEAHYGLALAKVVGLPQDVIDVAEAVSRKLTANMEKRKRSSKQVALTRRRRLILGLKEQLVLAKEGNMKGKVLAMWLKELQDQFVIRMTEIESDVADTAVHEQEDEETSEKGTFGAYEDVRTQIGRKKRMIGRETTSHGAMDTDTDTDLLADVECVASNQSSPASAQQSPFTSSSFFINRAGFMHTAEDDEDWCVRTDSNAASPVSGYEMTGAQQA